MLKGDFRLVDGLEPTETPETVGVSSSGVVGAGDGTAPTAGQGGRRRLKSVGDGGGGGSRVISPGFVEDHGVGGGADADASDGEDGFFRIEQSSPFGGSRAAGVSHRDGASWQAWMGQGVDEEDGGEGLVAPGITGRRALLPFFQKPFRKAPEEEDDRVQVIVGVAFEVRQDGLAMGNALLG